MRRRDLVAAAAGAVVATALAGSVALAAIPGPGGVIQGCYDSGGNLKVVEALSCPKNYTALRWNQQGIQGLPGADGEDGTDGTSPTVVQLVPGDPNCQQAALRSRTRQARAHTSAAGRTEQTGSPSQAPSPVPTVSTRSA